MKDYAEKEGLLCQPGKMLISSFFLENGTLITPLLLFCLDLELVCKKIYRFVEYIPVRHSNEFVLSAVNARREETIFQTQLLSRKPRNCLPTAPKSIKLWIVVATLSQNF